jgi:hypothetical protein
MQLGQQQEWVSRMNPRDSFRNFLERAEQDAWIASYKWFVAETFGFLKIKMGKLPGENYSRSHKRGTDGLWYGVEVEAHEGTGIGVDLELLVSRPILDDPSWITTRLNMPRTSSPQKILEEWSAREAAFKSLAPNNQGVLVSHFRRSAPGTLALFSPQGESLIQTRTSVSQKWVLSLAWRSSS